jgi:hypothetical protein
MRRSERCRRCEAVLGRKASVGRLSRRAWVGRPRWQHCCCSWAAGWRRAAEETRCSGRRAADSSASNRTLLIGSRKGAIGRCALPPVVLRVVSARVRRIRRRRRHPRVRRSAVRIVDAQVRRRMAIKEGRTVASVHGSVCLDQVRGRAITARAAIRVDGAIASKVTSVRAVVRRRITAEARGSRTTIRVGEALVVRTPAGPDLASIREAPAVDAGGALGVRRAASGIGGKE